MTDTTMKTTIENIERDAEKVIDLARVTARGILDEAKTGANKILTSDLPLDDILNEQNKIIETAHEESRKELDSSQRKGSQIKTRAESRIDETVRFIVTYIKEK